jgi:hypothetical protein
LSVAFTGPSLNKYENRVVTSQRVLFKLYNIKIGSHNLNFCLQVEISQKLIQIINYENAMTEDDLGRALLPQVGEFIAALGKLFGTLLGTTTATTTTSTTPKTS